MQLPCARAGEIAWGNRQEENQQHKLGMKTRALVSAVMVPRTWNAFPDKKELLLWAFLGEHGFSQLSVRCAPPLRPCGLVTDVTAKRGLEINWDKAVSVSALSCPESPWPPSSQDHQRKACFLGFFIKNMYILRRCVPLTFSE